MISASLKLLRDEEIILQIGGRGIAKTLPLPRFFAACAGTQACAVCDDALRVNAARLFVCIVSAMCAGVARVNCLR